MEYLFGIVKDLPVQLTVGVSAAVGIFVLEVFLSGAWLDILRVRRGVKTCKEE